MAKKPSACLRSDGMQAQGERAARMEERGFALGSASVHLNDHEHDVHYGFDGLAGIVGS